jgi:hypothetical protein
MNRIILILSVVASLSSGITLICLLNYQSERENDLEKGIINLNNSALNRIQNCDDGFEDIIHNLVAEKDKYKKAFELAFYEKVITKQKSRSRFYRFRYNFDQSNDLKTWASGATMLTDTVDTMKFNEE